MAVGDACGGAQPIRVPGRGVIGLGIEELWTLGRKSLDVRGIRLVVPSLSDAFREMVVRSVGKCMVHDRFMKQRLSIHQQ